MKKWEYQVTSVHFVGGWTKSKPDPKVLAEIQQMGDMGWEPVEVIPGAPGLGAGINVVMFWKREK